MGTETLVIVGLASVFVALALGFGGFGRRPNQLPSRVDGEGFQRGIAFALLADALLAVFAGGLLNPVFPDLAPLIVMLTVTLGAGRRVLRAQPSPIL